MKFQQTEINLNFVTHFEALVLLEGVKCKMQRMQAFL